MVFLWNSCCQFLSHCVCFVPVVLIVLILVVPYSHHVVSVFPLGSCMWAITLSNVTSMRHLCTAVSLSLVQASSSLTSIHGVEALSQAWRYMWAKPLLNQVLFRSWAAFWFLLGPVPFGDRQVFLHGSWLAKGPRETLIESSPLFFLHLHGNTMSGYFHRWMKTRLKIQK